MNVVATLRTVSLAFVVACSAAGAAQPAASAARSNYPEKPVRMLLGVPPGGGTDIVARIIALKLAPLLGQQVVIDNRGGAGGSIATDMVARAEPDGYTLLFALASHTTTPFLYKSVPYDPYKSFTPILQISTQPLVVVVHPSLPVHTMADLISYTKANPGKLNIGIASAGSAGHIAWEFFRQTTGINVVTVIYKGGGPAQMALLTGEAQMMFASTITAMGFIKQGKVRTLATSSERRLSYLPDVPTLEEAGVKGLRISPWQGLLGPAKLPREIVVRLHKEVTTLLRQQDTLDRLAANGTDPIGSTPEEFAAVIQRELKEFGALIRKAKISAE
jgi:tripartite-type tricarboxylate transporter receptor subunit TctC